MKDFFPNNLFPILQFTNQLCTHHHSSFPTLKKLTIDHSISTLIRYNVCYCKVSLPLGNFCYLSGYQNINYTFQTFNDTADGCVIQTTGLIRGRLGCRCLFIYFLFFASQVFILYSLFSTFNLIFPLFYKMIIFDFLIIPHIEAIICFVTHVYI